MLALVVIAVVLGGSAAAWEFDGQPINETTTVINDSLVASYTGFEHETLGSWVTTGLYNASISNRSTTGNKSVRIDATSDMGDGNLWSDGNFSENWTFSYDFRENVSSAVSANHWSKTNFWENDTGHWRVEWGFDTDVLTGTAVVRVVKPDGTVIVEQTDVQLPPQENWTHIRVGIDNTTLNWNASYLNGTTIETLTYTFDRTHSGSLGVGEHTGGTTSGEAHFDNITGIPGNVGKYVTGWDSAGGVIRPGTIRSNHSLGNGSNVITVFVEATNNTSEVQHRAQIRLDENATYELSLLRTQHTRARIVFNKTVNGSPRMYSLSLRRGTMSAVYVGVPMTVSQRGIVKYDHRSQDQTDIGQYVRFNTSANAQVNVTKFGKNVTYTVSMSSGRFTATVGNLSAFAEYTVYQDGTKWKTVTANESGYISYTKTQGWSTHEFTVTKATGAAVVIQTEELIREVIPGWVYLLVGALIVVVYRYNS